MKVPNKRAKSRYVQPDRRRDGSLFELLHVAELANLSVDLEAK